VFTFVLTTGIFAVMLGVYFDWRGRLVRHLRTGHDCGRPRDEAAGGA
jgi:hypothetical protein